jgi:hypothetical protein
MDFGASPHGVCGGHDIGGKPHAQHRNAELVEKLKETSMMLPLL